MLEKFDGRVILVDRSSEMRAYALRYVPRKLAGSGRFAIWSDTEFLERMGGVERGIDLILFIEFLQHIPDQTFRDYELIVVDDGSIDGTEEVVKRYGDQIKYLRQENRGPGPAKNTGIKNSRGPLIATLDADDKWLPDKLEIQVEYMRSHPQTGLVYGNVSTFDDRGVITEAYDGTHRKVYQGEVFDQLLLQNFISSITITVAVCPHSLIDCSGVLLFFISYDGIWVD